MRIDAATWDAASEADRARWARSAGVGPTQADDVARYTWDELGRLYVYPATREHLAGHVVGTSWCEACGVQPRRDDGSGLCRECGDRPTCSECGSAFDDAPGPRCRTCEDWVVEGRP